MSDITWHRPEFQGKDDQLVSLAGVAVFAGVTRAAVSNWRKRHDFPKPVMTAGRTVWVVRTEAETWLASRSTQSATDTETKRAALEAREARQAIALATTRKKLRELRQQH
ncbi:AlpA family phage regulatory protein [Streptomyces sp. SID12488]|uniref:helix-turn-helix transcriptional regulator n=1 Tax=Streptomyces sp. SID12488 TaxID=2706040 RepID=UPI0013DCCF67|nr:AlpA family phage regulatory protein [Streptomyces sp. SID12488]NEA67529.1 AlpA family phage regulatory protein [Streptomyces sp. SID12488]